MLAIALPAGAAEVEIIWLDGDTFEVQGERYRLANIDAPETDQPLGDLATRLAFEWSIQHDVEAYIDPTRGNNGKDKYGRWITVLCEKGSFPPICINDLLVEAGLAWVYTRYNNNPDLPALQKWAQAERLGVWADDNPCPPWKHRRGQC